MKPNSFFAATPVKNGTPAAYYLLTPFLLALCANTALAQTEYTPYTITTLAGLAGASGSADGSGAAARFFFPHGVAVDTGGNVYVSDFLNNTIRKVTTAGVVTTLAGSAAALPGSVDGPGSVARFSRPDGVAVDTAGNVYVADSQNSKIRMVSPAGDVFTLAGYVNNSAGSTDGTNSGAGFRFPVGVATGLGGTLYVADTSNHTIRKMTPVAVPLGTNWVVTTLAGQAGSSGTNDGTGNSARFKSPYALGVDAGGNIYVADTGNNMIRKVTSAGVVTTLAGASSYGYADGTNTDARFEAPVALAVDSQTNLYVADANNLVVRKIRPVGANWVTTTAAGKDHTYGSADGTGEEARFDHLSGIAVAGSGAIYVADTFNNTIRKGITVNNSPIIVTSGTNFGFSGGKFGFNLGGPTGLVVVIEASTNLQSWIPLQTNTLGTNLQYFTDPQSGYSGRRFYRGRVQ